MPCHTFDVVAQLTRFGDSDRSDMPLYVPTANRRS
jgi:hypothetical protein